jgi:hypothetical protein
MQQLTQLTDPAGSRLSRRVVVLAGRIEAARLCRSPLVLLGLAIGAALVWWNGRGLVPEWWVWDVQIDSTLLVSAATLLLAAQLAAGRVRRDGAAQLYDSYPTSASSRTAALMLGLVGPLVLATMLIALEILWLDMHGAVGTPRLPVLAQGLLIVALGGATGVALGRYLASPIAGLFAVVGLGAVEADLLLPFSPPVQLPGGTAWLFPWTQPVLLRFLPGPTPTIPPAAHLAWLVALTALAVIAAIWRFDRRPRIIAVTSVATAGCLAVAGWSGWAETRPLLSAQRSLIYEATHPAQTESCMSKQGVRYCAYQGFQPDVARWATVVNGVLDRLPSRPGRTLTVRQVVDVDFYNPADYQPNASDSLVLRLDPELGQFVNAEATDPRLVPGSSAPPVYVDINWGAGSATGSYQLSLSIQVAWWVAGLPTTWKIVSYLSGRTLIYTQSACLPVSQAREAIALWLAASATPAAREAFLAGGGEVAPGSTGGVPTKVGGEWVSNYPDGVMVSGYQLSLQFTGQGAVLADAMLGLSARRVEAVLAARWPGWMNPQATDAQLAAALGIRLPAAPRPPLSMTSPDQPADLVCQ